MSLQSNVGGSSSLSIDEIRQTVAEWKYRDETIIVGDLLAKPPYNERTGKKIESDAAKLVIAARSGTIKKPLLDTFLSEYGLSNKEGIALMCLAESLLRIPDQRTAERLIADKIELGNWASHAGKADSALVNASTWALMLTGKLVTVDRKFTSSPGKWIRQLTNRVSEPVVQAALSRAMRILGREFVLGTSIESAMKRSDSANLYSYDMLGEAAREAQTASRYLESYLNAIRVIGTSKTSRSIGRPSISIKLSALHPRYEFSQRQRVLDEMISVLKKLCLAAAENDTDLTIDAEEADRLELSLDLFEALARDPDVSVLDGLGMVVQAYSKRALPVLDLLIALAGETGRVIPVRLVKGAYWDAEIKQSQVQGTSGFPVFTRKLTSDLSYLACAKKILEKPSKLKGQFATHNAHSVAGVMELAGSNRDFEFQRLHGMGESLYSVVSDCYASFPPVRIYAPVGPHDDLLAYLVRRLLENGANSSFVNRFLDENTEASDLVRDPIKSLNETETRFHPGIPLPGQLFAPDRINSEGVDLTAAKSVDQLVVAVEQSEAESFVAVSLVSGKLAGENGEPVLNPANRNDTVGQTSNCCQDDIDRAFFHAADAQTAWDECGGGERARLLTEFSDRLEANRSRFTAILCREAGKTYPDAVDEVREAIDFCRYYAVQAKRRFSWPEILPGPTGESNELSLHGRGVFVCISPWNFPLAIFLGQVTAALAAGNTVIAKPSEETPIVAFEAIRLLHASGVPVDACHLLIGDGSVGEALVRHPLTAGVAFTGSTSTAQRINLAMAETTSRPIAPLIAETGGQNAMVVDATALLEQVTDDVIHSAFLSAGQRCSALRVLFLQEDIADAAIEMIVGAMDELRVGDPRRPETDVGPIISEQAASLLRAHIDALTAKGQLIHAASLSDECVNGTFISPSLFEIAAIDELQEEHFGPILHIVRFKESDFDNVLRSISDTGFGLTFGIHSRIDSRTRGAARTARVGNVYVNRNMTGAVVGSQPFGGQRSSGTGPKAGGPNYLLRFATEKVVTVNTVATGGNADLLSLDTN